MSDKETGPPPDLEEKLRTFVWNVFKGADPQPKPSPSDCSGYVVPKELTPVLEELMKGDGALITHSLQPAPAPEFSWSGNKVTFVHNPGGWPLMMDVWEYGDENEARWVAGIIGLAREVHAKVHGVKK